MADTDLIMYIASDGAKLYSGFVFSFLQHDKQKNLYVISGVEYYEYQA